MNDFFAALYEGFNPVNLFYIEYFSDDMYESGVYTTIGWLMIISTLALTALYYFSLSNYGKLYKKQFWILWIGCIATLNYTMGYILANNAMNDFYSSAEEGNPYSFITYSQFGIYNLIWGLLLSIIVSVVIKGKSIKASKTPF